MKTNVESLAAMAGKVAGRGYRWIDQKWVEFALTDGGFAWVDDLAGGVRRETFCPKTWEFYFVP